MRGDRSGAGRALIAPRVQATTLRCGVPIYLLEDHASPTCDILGVLDGGLLLESPARAGLASLTFDMLDRGTRRRDEWALADALESDGAQLQYDVTRETAVVRARSLSEDEELLVALLGETLREPAFEEAALRRAKEETLLGLREAAFETFEQAYRRAAALLLGAEHPYAREPDGEEGVVESLTREELAAHHARAVTAGRLSLAVAGDIAPERTLALLEEHLGGLARGGAAAPPERAPEGVVPAALPAGEKGVATRVAIADKAQVDVVLMRPGVARSDPEFEACALADFLVGGSFVSRLNQRLRDREGLTYGAESGIVSGRSSGCWFAAFGVDARDLDRAVSLARAELRAFVERGVAAAELAEAQDYLTGSFPLRLETHSAIAAALLDCLRHGWGLDYLDRYCERVRALTREQVEAAARRLIDPDRLVVAAAGTFAD